MLGGILRAMAASFWGGHCCIVGTVHGVKQETGELWRGKSGKENNRERKEFYYVGLYVGVPQPMPGVSRPHFFVSCTIH